MAGKDVDITKSTRGHVMRAVDTTPPRCDTKFTGFVENGVLMKWASSKQEFNDKYFDTSYSNPSEIRNPPLHYIYMGSSTSRNSYNCDRSYPINSENLAQYNKYENSKVHYNLHGDCPEHKLDFETTFIGQIDDEGKKIFSYHTNDCKVFMKKLFEAKGALREAKLETKTLTFGWNMIMKWTFNENDFDMISSYLYLNHGLSLSTESSMFDSGNDILWTERNLEINLVIISV
jgi:hypothetical protein